MGLNAREKYIKKLNNRDSFKLANDKIYSREILEQFEIRVPKILGLLERRKDLLEFDFKILPKEFVIKPSHGSKGNGILVLKHYKDDVYQKVDRSFVKEKELRKHIISIIDGIFSLEKTFDTAIIEERIKPHPCFSTLDNVGLPDIRVIVVNMIPVMAMLRIPTKKSEGKANLHQGACAFGLDLKTGKIIHGISEGKTLTLTSKMREFELPFFDTILDYAVRSQEASGIGYLGVDITIDQDKGPLVIELNAQPGLEIQNANLASLRQRIKRIEHLRIKSVTEGINVAKSLFSFGGINYKYTSFDSIIGVSEIVQVVSKIGTMKEVRAFIDLKEKNSSMDRELAKRLGVNTITKNDELNFFIKGKKMKALVTFFDRKDELEARFVLGRNDIKGFLIDTEKRAPNIEKKVVKDKLYKNSIVDEILSSLDHDVKVIANLKPINLRQEEEKFLSSNCTINPIFKYKSLNFIPEFLEAKLDSLDLMDDPLGILFAKKRREIELKISLLKNRGNHEEFTKISQNLYGTPDELILRQAKRLIKQNRTIYKEKAELNTEEIILEIRKVLDQYKLSWEVIIKDNMVARISVGKSGKIFLRRGITFSRDRLKSTLIHEIETHVLTAFNGNKQEYKLMGQGMANYLKTQEGLALYNQVSNSNNKQSEELVTSAINYVGVSIAIESDFVTLFKYFITNGYDSKRAFRTCVHMKRGLTDTSRPGAFTKSIVYYTGYLDIIDYVKQNGDLRKLYIGKIALEDLKLTMKLPRLKEPSILPQFLLS